MRVLLSINPVHVDAIISGCKTFEFRRKIFSRKEIRTVLIYSTKPIGRLVGEFDIDAIIEDEPEILWASTQHGSGISKAFFDNYFDGRKKAYALKIGCVRVFNQPINPTDLFPNFVPPQSYKYVDFHADQLELL